MRRDIRAPGNTGVKAESFASEWVEITVHRVTIASSIKGIGVVANGGTTNLNTTARNLTATDVAIRVRSQNEGSAAIDSATVSAGGTDAEGDPRPSGAGAQNDVGLDESYDACDYALEGGIPVGTNATFHVFGASGRVFGTSGSAFQIYAGAPAAGAPGFSIPGVAQLAPGFFLFGSGTVPRGCDHTPISTPIPSTPGLIGVSLSPQAVLFNPTLAVSYNVERVLLCDRVRSARGRARGSEEAARNPGPALPSAIGRTLSALPIRTRRGPHGVLGDFLKFARTTKSAGGTVVVRHATSSRPLEYTALQPGKPADVGASTAPQA